MVPVTTNTTEKTSSVDNKSLGHLIATNPAQSRSISAKKLESKLLSVVELVSFRGFHNLLKLVMSSDHNRWTPNEAH